MDCPAFSRVDLLPLAGDDLALAQAQPLAALGVAWALRQIAPKRAQALASALELEQLPASAAQRLTLLHAGWQLANGALAHADALLSGLLDSGAPIDAALRADACQVARLLANTRGHQALASQHALDGLHWAERAQDPDRIALATLFIASDDVLLGKADVAEQLWRDRLTAHAEAVDSLCAGFAGSILGLLEFQLGHPDRAVLAFATAFDHLLAFGMGAPAVICAVNAAAALDDLQDLEAAMEWAQRGLELSRTMGLAYSLGLALCRVAGRLRQLNRLDEAQDLLTEARRALDPHRASRNFVLVLLESGHLAAAVGEPEQALGHFREALGYAEVLGDVAMLANVLIGLSEVALKRGDLDAAEDAARQVLANAQGVRSRLCREALMNLARCCVKRGEHAQALGFMRSALQPDGEVQTVRVAWWSELAECLAANGDFAQAYEAKLAGDRAARAERRDEAQRHATGLRVRMQTARLQAKAEAQRERADVLEATTRTLTQLGVVGQDLTSLLIESDVYEAIRRHVEGLLQAEHFAVYLLDEAGQVLNLVFGAQNERRFPLVAVPVDHPHAASARCLRERSELVLELDPDDDTVPWIPGSAHCRSALFAPLRAGERLLGVMSIQSQRAQAFGERELQVFRSLSAYASIAIANAQAYRALSETQARLARQHRLSAVMTMVAGVAHELNTPLGNALLASSLLSERSAAIRVLITERALSRAQLSSYVQDTEEAGVLVAMGLERANQLVQAFKQLVQDHRTLSRSRFSLRHATEQALAGHRTRIQVAGHRLIIDMPEELELEGYREPLNDLLGHWADNALLHGLRGKKGGGQLTIQARQPSVGRVELRLADDGSGMAPEVRSRAFDPFFSTRFGNQHSGLGLAVVHSVAVDLYGGELHLEGQVGEGTRLIWTFDQVTPLPLA